MLLSFQPLNAKFRYYIVLGLAVLTMAVVWFTLRSKAGYYFRALRDDQDATNALGIDPTRFKLVSLILSAFLTGLLGGAHLLVYSAVIIAVRDLRIRTANHGQDLLRLPRHHPTPSASGRAPWCGPDFPRSCGPSRR